MLVVIVVKKKHFQFVPKRLHEELLVVTAVFPVALLLVAAVAVWTCTDQERPCASQIKGRNSDQHNSCRQLLESILHVLCTLLQT